MEGTGSCRAAESSPTAASQAGSAVCDDQERRAGKESLFAARPALPARPQSRDPNPGIFDRHDGHAGNLRRIKKSPIDLFGPVALSAGLVMEENRPWWNVRISNP